VPIIFRLRDFARKNRVRSQTFSKIFAKNPAFRPNLRVSPEEAEMGNAHSVPGTHSVKSLSGVCQDVRLARRIPRNVRTTPPQKMGLVGSLKMSIPAKIFKRT